MSTLQTYFRAPFTLVSLLTFLTKDVVQNVLITPSCAKKTQQNPMWADGICDKSIVFVNRETLNFRRMIVAVMKQLEQLPKQLEKNLGFNRNQAHDLHVAGAALKPLRNELVMLCFTTVIIILLTKTYVWPIVLMVADGKAVDLHSNLQLWKGVNNWDYRKGTWVRTYFLNLGVKG